MFTLFGVCLYFFFKIVTQVAPPAELQTLMVLTMALCDVIVISADNDYRHRR